MRTWLKEIRISLGLTHDEIASKCGISRTYYTLIENGNRRPSVKNAKSIAEILGFDWTMFFSNCEKTSA